MNRNLKFEISSSIYDKITDGTHDSPKQKEEGKPLITSKHIKGRNIDFNSAYLISLEDFTKINERSQVEQWDVIVSMIGEYCGFCYIERNSNIDYAVKNVGLYKTGSKLEAEWLFYYLNSSIGQQYLNSVKSGSSQPYLTLGALRNLPILQPNSNLEKIQIAKVLSNLDAKIELNNKINQELEAMSKTLYDYWFVQFDFPFDFAQGKPNEQGKPYKSSGGKMVYNAELKRDVPEGWEVKELGDVIDIQRGISYKSSEINGEGIPMINLNSFFLNGTYKEKGIKTFSGKYSNKHIAKSGDLLIAATDVTRNADIIGKSILVPQYYQNDLVYSMDIAKIISNKLSNSYLMMLFNSEHYHNYIKWFASGTIVLHLNMDGIKWYKAEIPPIELINKYDEFYLPIADRINKTQQQNQQLATLRDWLLPMLMNGQVTVGEAEEKLNMAAEPQTEYKNGLRS
jgi:type I restriction enzyme S subunit